MKLNDKDSDGSIMESWPIRGDKGHSPEVIQNLLKETFPRNTT